MDQLYNTYVPLTLEHGELRMVISYWANSRRTQNRQFWRGETVMGSIIINEGQIVCIYKDPIHSFKSGSLKGKSVHLVIKKKRSINKKDEFLDFKRFYVTSNTLELILKKLRKLEEYDFRGYEFGLL